MKTILIIALSLSLLTDPTEKEKRKQKRIDRRIDRIMHRDYKQRRNDRTAIIVLVLGTILLWKAVDNSMKQ